MLTSGGTLKPTAHRVCVVYDAQDGHIVHVHHDISLHQGLHPSEAEVEAAALAQVHKRGRPTGQLKTLHVEPHEVQHQVRYKVNPQRRVLERTSA